LFPDSGITKGELCAYYEAVAPLMLPHVRGRPVTMERFPAGIDKKGFIQKDVSKGFPDWLERVEVPKKDGSVWISRMPALERPDVCVFDLDPARDEPEVLRAAALAVRRLLDELGLASWVK